MDPAFVPGVSQREPGGLSARDVIAIIQSLPGLLVGADIVELNPSQDPIGLTAPLCAKLVKELASPLIETGGPVVASAIADPRSTSPRPPDRHA